MSVIVIGDIHIKHDNIVDIEKFTIKVELLCKEKKPDFIVLLGDILDTHEKILSQCLNKACILINKLRKITKVFIIVGNHDMYNNQQFLTDNHCFNIFKYWDNVIVVDKVIEFEINDMKFIFCPYVSNKRFIEALNTIKDNWKRCKTIFCHQEFKGCKMGHIISVEGDEWSLDYPYIISGHIHSNQRPQDNIYYPGSSTQVAYGESSKNIIGYVTFEKDKDKYMLEEIDLQLPKKRIIYKNVEELDTYILSKSIDDIKLSVTGTVENFKCFKKSRKYREILENGIKVVFKPKKMIRREEKNGEEIIDEMYFSKVLLELISKDSDKKLLELYDEIMKM